MAFPTIPLVADGRVLTAVQANATSPRTFPNLSSLTKNSGDLLIAIIVAYQSTAGAFSTWGAGFTEFTDQFSSTTMAIGAAYKWSDGTETGTFTVAQSATITGHAAMFLLSIPGAHLSTPPEAGTKANGTTSAAAIPAFNPAGWDAEDTLWIMVGCCGETATGGAFQAMSAGDPTNYSDNVLTGISADAVGGVEGKVAFRQLNAASEDPPDFSPDLSNARNSGLLIAVRPAAAVPTGPPVFGQPRRAHRFLTVR